MKEALKEWSINVPWGCMALLSWGNPSGDPVLLVHGRQDSVSTFIPLLQFLPDKYYYVGFDLPGHGKSTPFPTGVMLMRTHFLAAVEAVVQHLGWSQFIYMSHSMGAELGLFYNVQHPHSITQLILLDIVPVLKLIQMQEFTAYFKNFYDDYYSNYEAYNVDNRVYTKRNVIQSVMRVRGLTEKQAELILERNLTRIGDDQYRLHWDKRLKSLAQLNVPNKFYIDLLTSNLPPTLLIAAQSSIDRMSEGAKELLTGFQKNRNFQTETVEGGHDIHFTNPKRIAECVCTFLEGTKAKL